MSPDKRDPARGWLHVEKLLADEEIDEVAGLSDDEVAAAIRARGGDPARRPSIDELMARAAAKANEAPPTPAPVASVVPLRRRSRAWIAWLAAATFGVFGVGLANMLSLPEPVGSAPPRVDRSSALAACRALKWDECERGLDEAREQDPAGESDRSVRVAREALAAARPPSRFPDAAP